MSAGWRPRAEDDLPDAATAADMGAPETDYSAIAAVAGNDPRLIRSLRASLAVIARRTDDPSLRSLCVQVLQGSQSVRRVFEHPSFQQMTARSLQNLEKGLERLDPDEREESYNSISRRHTPEETQFALMEGRPLPER